ncbi:MAG: hypothetical protein ABI461_01985 [Polyangiaceae bacterium]
MITTAWGQAELVEEVAVAQSNETKDFTTHVQLLRADDGEELLRFAYSTDDIARRGPVTLRVADLKRLAKSLEKTPKLRAHLEKLSAPKRPSTGASRF